MKTGSAPNANSSGRFGSYQQITCRVSVRCRFNSGTRSPIQAPAATMTAPASIVRSSRTIRMPRSNGSIATARVFGQDGRARRLARAADAGHWPGPAAASRLRAARRQCSRPEGRRPGSAALTSPASSNSKSSSCSRQASSEPATMALPGFPTSRMPVVVSTVSPLSRSSSRQFSKARADQRHIGGVLGIAEPDRP